MVFFKFFKFFSSSLNFCHLSSLPPPLFSSFLNFPPLTIIVPNCFSALAVQSAAAMAL